MATVPLVRRHAPAATQIEQGQTFQDIRARLNAPEYGGPKVVFPGMPNKMPLPGTQTYSTAEMPTILQSGSRAPQTPNAGNVSLNRRPSEPDLGSAMRRPNLIRQLSHGKGDVQALANKINISRFSLQEHCRNRTKGHGGLKCHASRRHHCHFKVKAKDNANPNLAMARHYMMVHAFGCIDPSCAAHKGEPVKERKRMGLGAIAKHLQSHKISISGEAWKALLTPAFTGVWPSAILDAFNWDAFARSGEPRDLFPRRKPASSPTGHSQAAQTSAPLPQLNQGNGANSRSDSVIKQAALNGRLSPQQQNQLSAAQWKGYGDGRQLGGPSTYGINNAAAYATYSTPLQQTNQASTVPWSRYGSGQALGTRTDDSDRPSHQPLPWAHPSTFKWPQTV